MCSEKKRRKPKPNPRLITKCRIRYADDVLLSEEIGTALPALGSCEHCVSVPAGCLKCQASPGCCCLG